MRGLTLKVTNTTAAPLTITDVTGLATLAAGETRDILYTSEVQASLEYGRLNSLIITGTVTVSFVSGTNLNQAPIGRIFTGASPVAMGERGLVPQAAIAQRTYYLKGDGTWGPITALGIGAITQSILTTQGDLIVRGVTTAERLPLGSLGYILRSGPVTAQWAALATSGTTAARPSSGEYYGGSFYWTTDTPALFVCAFDGAAWSWWDLGVFGNSVQKNGVLVGTRRTLNFTGSVTVVDDPGNNRVNIGIVGGGGGGFPADTILWVSGSAPAGGDGSMGLPFNTIQNACDAVPDGADIWVMIAPGAYNENLAITGTNRAITLCGLGAFILGDGTITGDIAWFVETDTSRAATLRICSIQNVGSADTTGSNTSRPNISKGITAIGTTPTTYDAHLEVSAYVLGDIDATAFETPGTNLILRLEHATVAGSISGLTTSIVYAGDSALVGPVNVGTLFQATRTTFNGTISLQTSMVVPGTSGLQNGFYACSLKGNVTGPGGGSVYMDGSTYWSMKTYGSSVVGDTLDIVDWADGNQTRYAPAVPANWVPPAIVPPSLVQEALDQLASRVTALEGSGVPSTLTEDFLSADPLIAVGDAVCHDLITDTVKRADATSIATAPARGIAIALLPGNIVRVKWQGSVGGYVGLIPGVTYYLSIGVPGGITNADTSLGPPNSICQEIGYARSATTLFVMIDADYIVN